MVFRSRGDSNADENLIMLCVACHLRLVHRGYLRISGQAGELRFERAGEVLLGEMRVVSLEALRGCCRPIPPHRSCHESRRGWPARPEPEPLPGR